MDANREIRNHLLNLNTSNLYVNQKSWIQKAAASIDALMAQNAVQTQQIAELRAEVKRLNKSPWFEVIKLEPSEVERRSKQQDTIEEDTA